MSRNARMLGGLSPLRRVALEGCLAATCLAGTGCATLAPKTEPGRPTAVMQEAGVTMSTVELRQRIDGLVPPVLASIEDALDTIMAEATDPEVRRQALYMKIDTVPVVYRAAFQPDPFAAHLDLWLLLYQMEACLDAGTEPCRFGAQQPIARKAGRDLRELYEREVRRVAHDLDALERMRRTVKEIADRSPLVGERGMARRYTMTAELAEAIGSDSRDAFAVVGDVSMTLTELSSRLNTYIGDAGRLGRWHAELLLEDVKASPEFTTAFTRVDEVARDIDRATTSLEGIEETLEPEGIARLAARLETLVREERGLVLADVERQRNLTLQYVTAEREAVLAAMDAERMALMEQVRGERAAAFEDVDQVRRDLVDDAVTQSFRIVDHLVWRLAQLLGGLLVLGALLAWLVLKTGGVAALIGPRRNA